MRRIPLFQLCLLIFAVILLVTCHEMVDGTPFPMGSVTITGPSMHCPPDRDVYDVCLKGIVSGCKWSNGTIQNIGFNLAYGNNTQNSTYRGVVVYFSGAGGNSYWTHPPESFGSQHLKEMRAAGYVVAQVKWEKVAWLSSEPGQVAGSSRLACRPATITKYLYEQLYESRPERPGAPGSCGFCVTGNSGGSSAVSYIMTHYGGKDFIHKVIPTSGPPHAAQQIGCDISSPKNCVYPPWAAKLIDSSYGYSDDQGPCSERSTDPKWVQTWERESVDSDTGEFVYGSDDRIKAHILLGELDSTSAFCLGKYYYQKLEEKGKSGALTIVPNMSHEIVNTKDGVDALKGVILAKEQ